jgi:quercetin dioxygenase-like cupin family protein
MTIRLQFDRIPPEVQVGPHRHGVETIAFVAAGAVAFEHGEDLERRVVVRAGDVLYEAPSEYHLIRNEGTIDALVLLAAVEPETQAPGIDVRRWDQPGDPVRRREGARVITRAGLVHRVLVEPGDFGTASFTVGEIELSPGAGTGWHRHLRAEHVIVVLEGRGTVRVGAVEETLEPLKGVRVETGLPHAISNTGRTPLRYFLCATPATDPLSDRETAEPPS